MMKYTEKLQICVPIAYYSMHIIFTHESFCSIPRNSLHLHSLVSSHKHSTATALPCEGQLTSVCLV